MKELSKYLRGQGLGGETIETVLQILAEWQKGEIHFWQANEVNPKEWARSGVILGSAVEKDQKVRFFAPVCPDYPADSRMGQLGTGIFVADRPFIPLSRIIVDSLKKRGIEFDFDFLLADTETDLEEVVVRLAGSGGEFLNRCSKSVEAFKKEVPLEVRVHSFSEFFEGCWHEMQYFWEERVREEMKLDEKFGRWLEMLAWQRTEKYERQFGRRLDQKERVMMAVRHFAQYAALGFWMRQYPGAIMLNTDSPNLSVIRRPLLITNPPDFLPLVINQQQRIPIIVP